MVFVLYCECYINLKAYALRNGDSFSCFIKEYENVKINKLLFI